MYLREQEKANISSIPVVGSDGWSPSGHLLKPK